MRSPPADRLRAPSSATSEGALGIDGTLDGVPASLKAYSGSSPTAILRYASAAERSAANAGYSGVELFIDAPNVEMSRLLDFGLNGPLNDIPGQGVISSIYARTGGRLGHLPRMRNGYRAGSSLQATARCGISGAPPWANAAQPKLIMLRV